MIFCIVLVIRHLVLEQYSIFIMYTHIKIYCLYFLQMAITICVFQGKFVMPVIGTKLTDIDGLNLCINQELVF